MNELSKTEFLTRYSFKDLQGLSVFGALTEPFIKHLIDNSDILLTESDTYLFSKGQDADCFYILIDGNIVLYNGLQRENHKIKELDKGECVGFICMLCLVPLPGEVIAEQGSVIFRIERRLFSTLYQVNGEQFTIFLMNLARNIGRSYIEEISLKI